ncbi:MAG: sensor histidine kinase [Clostridia bacterium]
MRVRKPLPKSLKAQLLVYMVLLIAAPMLFLTAFGNYFFSAAIDEQATDFSTQMLAQVRLNVDATVTAIDRIFDYLAADERIRDYLRLEDFYDADRVRAETAARLAMRTYISANADIVSGILAASEHDLYASSELYRINRTSLCGESWYRQAIDEKGARLLISKPIGRNIRNYQQYSANDIVSFVRAVMDETGQPLGVLCIDMHLTQLKARVSALTLGKSGYVFILDDMGQVVYAPVNDTVYRIEPKWLDQDAAMHTMNGEPYQLLTNRSELTGWRVVGVFKSGELLSPVLVLRRYILLVTLIAIALATVIALTFTASFTQPISLLRRLMGEAEHGNLDVKFDNAHYTGEIAQLGASFNAMMDKIRSLLQLVYDQQKNKREADIRTLQAQIKPHFLYNTLDTIRWMAEEYEASEIVDMINALTRLFRIALSRGKDVIFLGEELEHVRCYLYIQKVRYEEKLNYTIDCDPSLANLRVDKLILQPLVENAIYHGIKQKRGEGHIVVSVALREQALIMRVSDDGAGMSEERARELNSALSSPDGREYDHGYGIFNVNDRIRLAHGPNYGLYYRINAAGGVTVTITYPVIEKEDE